LRQAYDYWQNQPDCYSQTSKSTFQMPGPCEPDIRTSTWIQTTNQEQMRASPPKYSQVDPWCVSQTQVTHNEFLVPSGVTTVRRKPNGTPNGPKRLKPQDTMAFKNSRERAPVRGRALIVDRSRFPMVARLYQSVDSRLIPSTSVYRLC